MSLARAFSAGVCVVWFAGGVCGAPPLVLSEFDTPFQFTYGSWENRASVVAGKARLRGDGVTGQGGGGANVSLDLSASAEDSPYLKLRVGPQNKVGLLRVLLRDAGEQAATYEFVVPPAGEEFVTVYARGGTALRTPMSLEKQGVPFDLSRVRQWQILGDWSDKPCDIEVESIGIIPANAEILAARAEKERKDADERERVRKEQEALSARYRVGAPDAPVIRQVSRVAPDVISLTIQSGRVVPSTLAPYAPQAGDERVERDRQVILKRGGQEVGWLIGGAFVPDGKRDHLVTFEKFIGDPLLTFAADQPANYSVDGAQPIAVFRKTRATDWAQPSKVFAMEHTIYLKMGRPLGTGRAHLIGLKGINVKKPLAVLSADVDRVRSEAIHVHQIGYRPDDPVKRAFLSLWMGTGGPYTYPDTLNFRVVEDMSGKAIFTGKVEKVLGMQENEQLQRADNFSKTNVYRMDFSGVRTPGRYRIVVDGMGCSYPFSIAADVWEKAFRVQMRGLANERSGVELAPPFADYRRPPDFQPALGVPVFQSTYSILDGSSESPELAKRSTGQRVPDAWGGYHDAGDWNPRRVTHMRVTMAQLEMLKLFPEFFGKMTLPIPHQTGVPDVLTEALFEIDCFRRLQKPDGGVPFGIETDGDPVEGEVSFLQSMPAYVYAPDPASSYYYAAVAGRAAQLLKKYSPELAKTYRESALKAMLWAEADRAKRKEAGTLKQLPWTVKDDRNLAAVILYELTEDPRWHEVFQEETVLKDPNTSLFIWGTAVQRDAAFAYTLLPSRLTDPILRDTAVDGLRRQADAALEYARGNAFNLTTPDKGKPLILGFFSTPDAIELCRAHYLTKRSEYLAGAVQATQFQAGCNPGNRTYTTGLGNNPPKNPLFLDTRRMGVPAPTGLTVYGNWDRKSIPDFSEWVNQYFLNPQLTPPANDWPVTEAYFDIFLAPSTNEFTVDIWAPNIYVWGYLAARK
ncbi:MAG: glycoside hydrolase family 9 protein [Capsulimonadales bacterium]|nr:glycoside hydrolase family 9 protein [Capsulimonadales bacterium]